MSTNALIGYVTKNGSVLNVYHHWDGYPTMILPLLTQNYSDLESVKQLVAMGGISSLASTIKTTTFYARDRNEELDIYTEADVDAFYTEADNIGYGYLFVDGKWEYK